MNNTQKRTLRRIIIETALLLLLLPLQARAAEYKCTAELPVEVRTSGAATAERFTITLTPEDGAPAQQVQPPRYRPADASVTENQEVAFPDGAAAQLQQQGKAALCGGYGV